MAGFFVHLQSNPGLFQDRFEQVYTEFATAWSKSAQETVEMIQERGKQDIASAGKFGSRWTDALTVVCTPDPSTVSDRYEIEVYIDIPYGHVFEFGANIKGKPSLFNPEGLLWIPLSGTAKITAQEYGLTVGPLVRVPRQGMTRPGGGKPLLFDIKAKQPAFFGMQAVTIPQKFHIRQICEEIANNFSDIFHKNLPEGT